MKTASLNPPSDFALLLVGRPGSGKSTLAGRFPSPYFFSLDRNLRGPSSILLAEGKDFSYDDDFDLDDKGLPITDVGMGFVWNKIATRYSEVVNDPAIKTLVFDNTTVISDLIIADILRQQGRKAMEIRDWGDYLKCWKQFFLKIRRCGKFVVVISHERVEKDEMDGTLKYFLAVHGQAADIIPSLVTDVWRCEVGEELVGQTKQVKYKVRIISNTRHEMLKSSLPLKNMFEATTSNVNEALAALSRITNPTQS